MKKSLIEKIVREELKKKINKNLVKEADAKADARMISRHTRTNADLREGRRYRVHKYRDFRSEQNQFVRDSAHTFKNLHRGIVHWIEYTLPFEIDQRDHLNKEKAALKIVNLFSPVDPYGSEVDEDHLLDYLGDFINSLERAKDSKIKFVKQKYADEPEKTLEYQVDYVAGYFDDEIKKWSDFEEDYRAKLSFFYDPNNEERRRSELE